MNKSTQKHTTKEFIDALKNNVSVRDTVIFCLFGKMEEGAIVEISESCLCKIAIKDRTETCTACASEIAVVTEQLKANRNKNPENFI